MITHGEPLTSSLEFSTDDLTHKVDKTSKIPQNKSASRSLGNERWKFPGYTGDWYMLKALLNLTTSSRWHSLVWLVHPHMDIVNDNGNINAIWAIRCNTPGLAADFRGKLVRLTMPVAGGVCSMTGQEVKNIVTLWDEATRKNYDLRGNSPLNRLQQWFTVDIQPHGLVLHSGDPTVGTINYADNANDEFLLGGNWASLWNPFYVYGAQFSSNLWNFALGYESSPTIFAYFQMVRLAGLDWDSIDEIQDAVASTELVTWLNNPSFTSTDYVTRVRFLVYTQVWSLYLAYKNFQCGS